MRRYKEIPGMGYWHLDPHPPWMMLRQVKAEDVSHHKRMVRQELFNHQKPMDADEKAVVLAYMAAATVLQTWRGHSYCRLCPTREDLGVTNMNDTPGDLGYRCMLTPDGKWKFPEKWEHYIIEHSLRPTKKAFTEGAITWAKNRSQKRARDLWNQRMGEKELEEARRKVQETADRRRR